MSPYNDDKLYDFLKTARIIDAKALDGARNESKASQTSLASILIKKDLITDAALGKIIADLWGVPYVRLAEVSIPADILSLIPETIAKEQRIIPFEKNERELKLAMESPTINQETEFISKKIGLPVRLYFATSSDIDDALNLYKNDVKQTFDEIIAAHVAAAKGSKSPQDPPITKIVDTLIQFAYDNKASDIHIEPERGKSLVRFRIDGVLHDMLSLPLEIHPQIVTRIKVLANLRTDEHQAAQDGKIIYSAAKEELDIRISIVPITNGENVAMRLLSETSRQFGLNDLGLAARDLAKVQDALTKPHGMILATGPTGSGKTTTIYSILKLLNKPNVNIMTIEDPVEYDIERVNQIQVNAKTNLTFAAGLRSIVRQDPDVILVGEIRDEETADIAVNAAMTGHLVLSTVHTNDAATTLPRLIDMKIEPYLIASSVNVIIAQRLVRKICAKCRVSLDKQKLTEKLTSSASNSLKEYFTKSNATFYEGKGCMVCHNSGYVGRIGIFEVMLLDDDLKKAVTEKKDASEIQKIAIKNGMKLMIADGIDKIKQGITTIDEVLRVTKE